MTAWDIDLEKLIEHAEVMIRGLDILMITGKASQADITLRHTLKHALAQYRSKTVGPMLECPDCGADLAVGGHTKECERYRNEARGWP